VLTELPSGPLFRVVGYPLHIPCNVSGFKDTERQKKFEVRMQQPGKTQEINIISTDDAHFAFSQFKGRVKNNNITLENVAPNSVFFTITNLIASDEGEYECSVINYEGTFIGLYTCKIVVKGNIIFEPRPSNFNSIKSTFKCIIVLYFQIQLISYFPSL